MTYTRFNTSQCKDLENLYKKSPKPSVEERNELAKKFKTDASRITRWFERRNNKDKAEKKNSEGGQKDQEEPADDVVHGNPPQPQDPKPQDLNDLQQKNPSGDSRPSDDPKEDPINVVHENPKKPEEVARESDEDVVEIKKEVPEQNSTDLYREPKPEEIEDAPAPFWPYHNGPIKYPVAVYKEDQRKDFVLIQKIRTQFGPLRTQNPAKKYYTNPNPTITPGSVRQSLGQHVQFNSYVPPRPSTSQEAASPSASNPSLGPIRNKVNHSDQIRSAIHGKTRNYGQSHPYARYPLSNEETENMRRVTDAQKAKISTIIKKEFAGTSSNALRRLSSTTSGSHASSSGISSSNTTVSLGSPSSGPMPTPSPVSASERVSSNSQQAQELRLSTPSPAASKIPAPIEVLTVKKSEAEKKDPEESTPPAMPSGQVRTTEPIKLDQPEDSATEKKNPEDLILQIDEARRKQLNEDRISNFAPFFKSTFLPFSMSTIYPAWSKQEVQQFLCQFLKPAAMETLKNLNGPDLEKIRFDNRAYFNELSKNENGLSWMEYLSIEGQINEIKSYNHKMAMFRASM